MLDFLFWPAERYDPFRTDGGYWVPYYMGLYDAWDLWEEHFGYVPNKKV